MSVSSGSSRRSGSSAHVTHSLAREYEYFVTQDLVAMLYTAFNGRLFLQENFHASAGPHQFSADGRQHEIDFLVECGLNGYNDTDDDGNRRHQQLSFDALPEPESPQNWPEERVLYAIESHPISLEASASTTYSVIFEFSTDPAKWQSKLDQLAGNIQALASTRPLEVLVAGIVLPEFPRNKKSKQTPHFAIVSMKEYINDKPVLRELMQLGRLLFLRYPSTIQTIGSDLRDLKPALAQVQHNVTGLQAGQAELQAGQAELQAGQAELQAELHAGQAELQAGQAELQAELHATQAAIQAQLAALQESLAKLTAALLPT